MNQLIEQHRHELEDICRRFHVKKMELFGSATDARFDIETSDLDFLVAFHELETGNYADAYFGLLEALQVLFQRPVDLVVASAVKNPYFLKEIEKTKTLLYAETFHPPVRGQYPTTIGEKGTSSPSGRGLR